MGKKPWKLNLDTQKSQKKVNGKSFFQINPMLNSPGCKSTNPRKFDIELNHYLSQIEVLHQGKIHPSTRSEQLFSVRSFSSSSFSWRFVPILFSIWGCSSCCLEVWELEHPSDFHKKCILSKIWHFVWFVVTRQATILKRTEKPWGTVFRHRRCWKFFGKWRCR